MNLKHNVVIKSLLLNLSLTGVLSLQAQQFTEVKTIVIPGVQKGSVKWADYDNDGDLDFLINGETSYSVREKTSKLFRNEGNDTFTENNTVNFTKYSSGDTQWGDLDNDGDLDVLFVGSDGSGDNAVSLYRNERKGLFEHYRAGFRSGFYCSLDWGDYDNDGDLDLIYTGKVMLNPTSKIYRNKGNGFFNEMDIDLIGVQEGVAKWADFDNDGDLDLLIAGSYKTQIYFNHGNNTFLPDTVSKIDGSSECMADIGDYDNDGYLDFIICSRVITQKVKSKSTIYRNNGDGSFSEQADISIRGAFNGSVNWVDLDNDGDLDLFISGYSDSYEQYSAIYFNQGNNVFTEDSASIIDLCHSAADWGDYDGDGDLDLLVSGLNSGNITTKLYKNNTPIINLPPDAPKNLKSQIVGNDVNLSWSAPSDDHTPKVALTYNLRIGTTKTGCEIASPMAISDLSDPKCGFRLVSRPGQINSVPKWTAKNLKTGKYYWQAQAIDQSFQGGRFSAIDSFEIKIPTLQISNIKIKNVIDNRATIQWSYGNGQKTVLFITDDFSSFPVLNSGDKFVADSVLYKKSQSEVNGWRCIYNGTDSICTVTGLYPNVPYQLAAFNYNSFDGENFYLTSIDENTAHLRVLFFERPDPTIVQVMYGDADWGDFDGDGNIDLAITGHANTGRISEVYRNMGNNSFSSTDNSGHMEGMGFSSVDWGDFNKDGKPDLLITGYYYAFKMTWDTKIYENKGNGYFWPLQSVVLPGAASARSCWVDYNLDGYDDIFLSGTSSSGNFITLLYRNNKDNTFSMLPINTFPILASNAAWGDMNNDGLPDVILTGADASFLNSHTKVFKNNGDDTFTEITGVVEHAGSGTDLHDLNNDGLPELLVGGRVFINHGNFSFTEKSIYPESVKKPACFDFNGDGFLDLIYFNNQSSRLYLNNGDATFQEPIIFFLPNMTLTSIDWADYDNDGDTDLFLTGYQGKNKEPISQIMINTQFSSSSVSPHLQSSNIRNVKKEENEYTIYWDNGGGQKRVVFMAPNNKELALPVDGTTYSASPDWLNPVKVSGNCYSVYNGTGNSVTMTNMQEGQRLSFEVFDYNGEPGHEKYNRSTAYNNPTDIALPVEELMGSEALFSCFPNPTTDKLIITYPVSSSEYDVLLSDTNGNIVIKTLGSGRYSALDVSLLSPGIYLVQVKDQSKTYRTKIVKMK